MIRVSTLLGLVFLALSSANSAPNVIIVVADDMGWGDVGYNGSEIRTPEIDRLVSQGVRFDRFYVQAVCSPTRASLMTGRSTLNTGVLSPFNPWYAKGLATDEKLLPEYLKEGGYHTHAVGKWHLGPNTPEYHPLQRGFDTFYGSLHGFLDHETHAVFGRVDWQRDGRTANDIGHTSVLIADEAVRLIKQRNPDAPMFLYVSFTAPHTPLQASEASIATYADLENDNRRVYAAMVSEMDQAIARITSALNEEQMTENTLLMFFSDNGGAGRSGASNLPLRGGKGSPWEGGIRVPALMYWPGVLDGTADFEQRMTILDVLPTVLAVTNSPTDAPHPIDGQNMWPALAEGEQIESQDVVLSNLNEMAGELVHAYFSDRWKLVQAVNSSGDIENYLYDVVSDPSEQIDLSNEHPTVTEKMVAELAAMPKAAALTLGERTPDRSAPGSPRATAPDNRPAIATPYAESGPIPHPPRNYPAEN